MDEIRIKLVISSEETKRPWYIRIKLPFMPSRHTGLIFDTSKFGQMTINLRDNDQFNYFIGDQLLVVLHYYHPFYGVQDENKQFVPHEALFEDAGFKQLREGEKT